MSTLYYAGPLFTDAERLWNLANAQVLRQQLVGWTVLMPQEFCAQFDGGTAGKPDFGQVYTACLTHLDRTDVVLAILDGADADSGTSFEMGYALAHKIPIIGLRSDWRPAEDGGGNCMLTRSCQKIVPDVTAAIVAIRALQKTGVA
jgi:nucleoside 2-deoxyribosyltransferase